MLLANGLLLIAGNTDVVCVNILIGSNNIVHQKFAFRYTIFIQPHLPVPHRHRFHLCLLPVDLV